MIQPYDYQDVCLKTIERARSKGKKKVLVVKASGLGKTVTSAFDTTQWLKKHPDSKVLYLCHQNDILSQAKNPFAAIVGGEDTRYGYYHGIKKNRGAQLLFASLQTMRSRMKQFDRREFDYIVIDESHHAPAETYYPVVKYFKPRFLLAMTATPDRMDLKDIRSLFGKEVFSLDLPEALAKNLLNPVDYRLIADEIVELGEIENPHRLSLGELNKKIFVPKRDKEIARIIKEKTADIRNPRIMIFCPSIRHVEKLKEHIPGSVTIHSHLRKKKQKKKKQKNTILFNNTPHTPR